MLPQSTLPSASIGRPIRRARFLSYSPPSIGPLSVWIFLTRSAGTIFPCASRNCSCPLTTSRLSFLPCGMSAGFPVVASTRVFPSSPRLRCIVSVVSDSTYSTWTSRNPVLNPRCMATHVSTLVVTSSASVMNAILPLRRSSVCLRSSARAASFSRATCSANPPWVCWRRAVSISSLRRSASWRFLR
ncbi:Uncharacterised protein [uncultured archaeon]|nr:Uncharacterised protein [uncultured archaeon]